MSGSKSKPINFIPHRRSQSQLPTLSLAELEKNYLASKLNKKYQQQFSLSNLAVRQTNHEMIIKSPFYERTNCTNKKGTCKCQFHKKQKIFVQKLFPFQKKSKIIQQLHLERLKTQQSPPILLQKKYHHQRMNSSINQFEGIRNKNQELKRLIQQNKQAYFEYLKKIKEDKSAEVDCYNLKFQQFLKTNDHWILRQVKLKKQGLLNKKSLHKFNKKNLNQNEAQINQQNNHNRNGQQENQSSQNERHNYRFKTLPSNFDDQNEIQNNTDGKSKKKKSKFHPDQKSSQRKTSKLLSFTPGHTQDSFFSGNKKSNFNFSKSIDSLNPQDRAVLEQFYRQAFQQIGLDYDQIRAQEIQNPNFFGIICKNLVDSDSNIVEKAKKVLRRISQLPLNLYSKVLKELRYQLQNNKQFNSRASIESKTQNEIQSKDEETQKSVGLAFQTIQNSIQDSIKNKEQSKGKEKLLILGKLKKKFLGRTSISSFIKSSQGKGKKRSSFSNSKTSSNLLQLAEQKKSRFASSGQFENPIQETEPNENPTIQQNNMAQNQKRSSMKLQDILSKQKQREVKKGTNLKKLKKNKNIIKMIDDQIEQENNKIKPIPQKKLNIKFDQQYEKQRAQNIQKQRNEEYRQHLQFLQKIRQRSQQRQSSTISEYEIKRNTVKSHYLRNKVFIKKMESYLNTNYDLKDMVINMQDNLFTKKRKVRILNQMVKQILIDDPNSQFYQDMKKYVDIFDKSCNMVVKQKKDKQCKKLSRLRNANGELFQQDFRGSQKPLQAFNFGEFISSINMDHQLKFYDIEHIQLEQEDIEAIVKQFNSHPIQQSFSTTNRGRKQKHELIKMNSQFKSLIEQRLMQISMDHNTQKVVMQKIYEPQQEQTNNQNQLLDLDSKQIKKLKERFRKNMEKYQKVFNLNRSFT